jgi:hypothetical protein
MEDEKYKRILAKKPQGKTMFGGRNVNGGIILKWTFLNVLTR